jgi:predicted NUDIX family NTP pyrophosphohydrolase
MPKRTSAGLLMYRIRDGQLQVLIVHPGGPFWAKKDAGSWSIPKGEIETGEEEFAAAQREFQEETGVVPAGPFIDIGEITQKSGKRVRAWAFEGDCDSAAIVSNTFSMEWPPRSGRMQSFPEIDRAEFVDASTARRKLNLAECDFVERLQKALRMEG